MTIEAKHAKPQRTDPIRIRQAARAALSARATLPAPADASIRMHEITATPDGLARLERFYHDAYVGEFPDADERESLASLQRYLAAKARGWYGANAYHIIVAEVAGRPVGGAVCDYLAQPNAGVIEFLFVSASMQRRGIGRMLHERAIGLLRADARAAGAARLSAIVAEMNDPFRRAATRDNLDPFERAAIWGRWGFAALQFRYVQPALSRAQRPVENLMLIVRMLARPRTTQVPAAWVLEVVGEYMRWAMRIPVPARNRQYRDMAASLGARTQLGLTPLLQVVGRDPSRPFEITPIAAGGGALRDALALLRRELACASRIVPPQEFRDALARPPTRAAHYRLWSLKSPGARRPEGLASFFSLEPCGFGGYIVLAGALRGRGILHLLGARIEEQMLRDSRSAEGWFVECGDDSIAPLLRIGFAAIEADYRPPSPGQHDHSDAAAPAERLHLLYKEFGQGEPARTPPRALVLECARAILRHVYRIPDPHRHACYRRLATSLPRSASSTAGS